VSRLISQSIWVNKEFLRLPKDEKLLYIYLLTSPRTNNLGVYEADLSFITFETGIPNVKFHLKRLSDFVAFDEENEIVVVRDFIRLTKLAGPKVEKGIYYEFRRQKNSIKQFLLKECSDIREIVIKFLQEEMEGGGEENVTDKILG